jgi:SPOR domain
VSTDAPDDRPIEPDGTAPTPEPLVCASCSAPLDDDQTYCLECGTPTAKAPRLSRGRGRGAVALGLAVLGLGTGGLAWAVASDRNPSGPVASSTTASGTAPAVTTIDTTGVPTLPPVTSGTPSTPTDPAATDTTFVTATSGTGSLPPPTTATSATTVSTASTTIAETTTTTDTGPASTETDTGSTASDWPAGRTAWTAVLASARNRSEAESVRDRAQGDGEKAGILVSADHSELKPGFFVVFSGVFGNRQTAIDQAARLKGSFARAYARKITG